MVLAHKTVAIIGGGIAGMSTAARLQAQGITTVVVEASKVVGGCAGYYKTKPKNNNNNNNKDDNNNKSITSSNENKKLNSVETHGGFYFDVGATTFVDFEEGGVGDELLKSIGAPKINGQLLPGYTAWLPDREVNLYRDQQKWHRERLTKLGNSESHIKFWKLFDQLSHAFWDSTRKGIKMPMRNMSDVIHNSKVVSPRHWHLARYLNWTTADALKQFGLYEDAPLKGLLGCLIEDTVNSSIDNSPLINAALGVSIRGAGLTRYEGGAYGFWETFEKHYKELGGELLLGCSARKVSGTEGNFTVHTSKGEIQAEHVVFAVPPPLAAKMNSDLEEKLRPYFERPDNKFGGGIVVFLGVPESEVEGQELLHHQLLQDYSQPQGNGNNMFISISPPGDIKSAPPGYRAVVISTHCELEPWKMHNFATAQEYYQKKKEMGDYLINLARKVYPKLATDPVVYEIGTPRTYQKFTKRPFGEVGGVRQTLSNSNQFAIPHSVGIEGMQLVGDGVWPGLGTVACVLGSRIVADSVSQKILANERKGNDKNNTSTSSFSAWLKRPCPVASLLLG